MTAETTVDQKPQDLGLQEQRYERMMQLMTISMAVISLIISGGMIFLNVNAEIIALVASTIVAYVILYYLFRIHQTRAAFRGLIYLTCLSGLIGNILIGWRSGIFVYFLLLIPVIFYNPIISKLEKIVMSLVYTLAILVGIVLGFLTVPPIHFNPFQLQMVNSFNILVTCIILGGILYLDYRNSNLISNRLIDLNHQLAYQASRDSLTNLLNRRTMNQLVQMEYTRSTRSGKTFGLIMADVDDFKLVNDEHGHAAGDLVLMELSALLTATLRKQDLISRWGGEEFLVLLPETDLEGVQVAAEKIREMVCHSNFMYQNKAIKITICIGGVVCQDNDDWDACLKHADRALYYGKNHGKNLAIFSKGETFCILGDSVAEFSSSN